MRPYPRYVNVAGGSSRVWVVPDDAEVAVLAERYRPWLPRLGSWSGGYGAVLCHLVSYALSVRDPLAAQRAVCAIDSRGDSVDWYGLVEYAPALEVIAAEPVASPTAWVSAVLAGQAAGFAEVPRAVGTVGESATLGEVAALAMLRAGRDRGSWQRYCHARSAVAEAIGKDAEVVALCWAAGAARRWPSMTERVLAAAGAPAACQGAWSHSEDWSVFVRGRVLAVSVSREVAGLVRRSLEGRAAWMFDAYLTPEVLVVDEAAGEMAASLSVRAAKGVGWGARAVRASVELAAAGGEVAEAGAALLEALDGALIVEGDELVAAARAVAVAPAGCLEVVACFAAGWAGSVEELIELAALVVADDTRRDDG